MLVRFVEPALAAEYTLNVSTHGKTMLSCSGTGLYSLFTGGSAKYNTSKKETKEYLVDFYNSIIKGHKAKITDDSITMKYSRNEGGFSGFNDITVNRRTGSIEDIFMDEGDNQKSSITDLQQWRPIFAL
jgi:hypothetical protein